MGEPRRTSEETEYLFLFLLKRNMCNTRQDNPQQNHPWQGVYPDLSSLNELFSAPAAVNPEQPSSWIAFLASLGLQPISGAQQEAGPAQDQPSAPPAPQTHDDQAFAGENQSRQQPSPQSPPHPNGHSCGYSCGAPHISHLLQAITSRLLHFLLYHGLPLHSLQPPRLPHPVRPLRGVGHLPALPSPAHRDGRTTPLLQHHLPPPPL